MTHTVIAGFARTPFARFGRSLKEVSAVDLGALVAREVLKRTGVAPEDVSETNFGSAVSAVRREAHRDQRGLRRHAARFHQAAGGRQRRHVGAAALLRSITNVNGGADALGHPTGASGAPLVMTLASELRARWRLGRSGVCGGFGQADAVLIEV